jgi:hypothetical protein
VDGHEEGNDEPPREGKKWVGDRRREQKREMTSTHRSNQSLLFHDLQINSIKRFQMIQENHIELKRFRHIEGFS